MSSHAVGSCRDTSGLNLFERWGPDCYKVGQHSATEKKDDEGVGVCCKGLRGTGELYSYFPLERLPETGTFFQSLCRAESIGMKKRKEITNLHDFSAHTLPLFRPGLGEAMESSGLEASVQSQSTSRFGWLAFVLGK